MEQGGAMLWRGRVATLCSKLVAPLDGRVGVNNRNSSRPLLQPTIADTLPTCFTCLFVARDVQTKQGAAFNVTHFESRITHLLYTAINTTGHGQVSHCLGFTKSLTSSIQRLVDVLHDNQGIAAISQVHLP